MAFTTVTWWITENYTVCVRTGCFATRARAESFGDQAMVAKVEAGSLVLRAKVSGKVLDTVSDRQIRVYRLKESSQGKLSVSLDDYDPLALALADFGSVPELLRLESHAFGVDDLALISAEQGERLEPRV